MKLLQAKKEAEARELEELRLAEEERRFKESQRIREIVYDIEQLRLKARLEEEDEENRDSESLVNRLRDFDGDEKEDHKFAVIPVRQRRQTTRICRRKLRGMLKHKF